jgi:hypothetical protein
LILKLSSNICSKLKNLSIYKYIQIFSNDGTLTRTAVIKKNLPFHRCIPEKWVIVTGLRNKGIKLEALLIIAQAGRK